MDLKKDRDIIQTLKLADCTNEFIAKFFEIKQLGNSRQLVRLLYNHKKQLLDKLHKAQKEIDCLDYLIFQLNENIN